MGQKKASGQSRLKPEAGQRGRISGAQRLKDQPHCDGGHSTCGRQITYRQRQQRRTAPAVMAVRISRADEPRPLTAEMAGRPGDWYSLFARFPLARAPASRPVGQNPRASSSVRTLILPDGASEVSYL